MESTLNIPTTVKPGGSPAFRIKALRTMLARIEAEAAEVRAALKALGDAPRSKAPKGAPETVPPWVEGRGFLPRIFDAHPEVRVLHDAFHAFPVLSEGTPAYDAARYGIKMPDTVKLKTQDRAYTSPIWYTP